MAVSNHSLGRRRLIKSVGRIAEDRDGIGGVELELVLCADREIILGIRSKPPSSFYDAAYPPSTLSPTEPHVGAHDAPTIGKMLVAGAGGRMLQNASASAFVTPW
jgi:hypothetical protein